MIQVYKKYDAKELCKLDTVRWNTIMNNCEAWERQICSQYRISVSLRQPFAGLSQQNDEVTVQGKTTEKEEEKVEENEWTKKEALKVPLRQPRAGLSQQNDEATVEGKTNEKEEENGSTKKEVLKVSGKKKEIDQETLRRQTEGPTTGYAATSGDKENRKENITSKRKAWAQKTAPLLTTFYQYLSPTKIEVRER